MANRTRLLLVAFCSLGLGAGAAGKLPPVNRAAFKRKLQGPWPSALRSVAFSPDGKRLAAGGEGSLFLVVWDVANGKKAIDLVNDRDLSQDVTSVRFSPDGAWLAVATAETKFSLWDAKSWKRKRAFSGHPGNVFGVAFSPDGKLIAAGCSGGIIKLWDVATGKKKGVLKGHASWAWPMVFSPSGKLLYSGGGEATIRIWDVARKKQVHTFAFVDKDDCVDALSLSPDGRYLAATGRLGAIGVWRLKDRKQVSKLFGSQCVFTKNSKRLLVLRGERLALVDPQSGATRSVVRLPRGSYKSLALSPDGRLLAVGTDSSGHADLWDVERLFGRNK
jgi:WD40 repeat protein